MDWKKLQWWINLPPNKRNNAGMAIIIVFLSSGFTTAIGLVNSNKNATIKSQQETIKENQETIKQLTIKFDNCMNSSITREKEFAERESNRANRVDSLSRVIHTVNTTIKKAIKNGK